MKRIFCFSFLLFMGIVFLLGACSQEKTFETDQGKVTIKENDKKIEFKSNKGNMTIEGDEQGGQVNIKTEEGESLEISYNKSKLPDDFPKDIPVYSPSEVTMSQTMGKNKGVMANLSTEDDKSKVAAFYKEALPKKGWKIKGEMSMGNMSLFQGEKDNRSLNVTINSENGKTTVSLIIGEA